MSEGKKWTPGKIILLILAILAGLGILCCGGFYFLAGDKIKGVAVLAQDSIKFVERLQKEFGPNTAFQMIQNGPAEFIIAVGVEGELTPERVVEVQDKTWKIMSEVFAKDGFVPMKQLAVGAPGAPGQQGGGGTVSEWTKHIVSVEDLVKRTGAPAPPVSSFIPDNLGKDNNVKVTVTTDGEDEKPGEKPEEDGGDKPGGK